MGYFAGFPGDLTRPIDRLRRQEFNNNSVIVTPGVTFVAQVGTMSGGLKLVVLPPAQSYPSGATLTIVDESYTVTNVNYLLVGAGAGNTYKGPNITKGGGWLTLSSDGISKWIVVAVDDQTPLDIWQPGCLLSTVSDQGMMVGQRTLPAATQFFAKVPVPRPTTTVNVNYQVTGAAVTFTNAYIAWYDSAGTMILQSATQTAVWNTTGWKTLAFAVTPVWTGPTTFGWVMFYCGTATTAPLFASTLEAVSSGGSSPNVGTSTSTRRAATLALANTAVMPNITPSSMAVSGSIFGASFT